jgi:hypothetical protein
VHRVGGEGQAVGFGEAVRLLEHEGDVGEGHRPILPSDDAPG